MNKFEITKRPLASDYREVSVSGDLFVHEFIKYANDLEKYVDYLESELSGITSIMNARFWKED